MKDVMQHPVEVVVDGSQVPGFEGFGLIQATLQGDAGRFDPSESGRVAVQLGVHEWTTLSADQVRAAVVGYR